MKTPEQMAEEYSKVNTSFVGGALGSYRQGLFEGFLAGYQAAQQWISVKDRLPEINQQFIAFVENKEVCNCCRYQNRSSDNSPSFYASTKTGLLICGLESISHWMPLPAAPKEEV